MHYGTLWRDPLHALWHTMEEPPTCTIGHYGGTPYMHYGTLWRNPLHALWHTMEEPPTCTMAHYGGTPYIHYWRFSTAWYGTVRYGSLLGGFPLGTVPGT